MFKTFNYLILLLFFVGCIAKGRVDISLMNTGKNSLKNLNVARVEILGDQIIITGSNLSKVTQVDLKESGMTKTFKVESATNSQIIGNGVSSISIGVGKMFDMILSNASASATMPVTFTLNNKSVTGAMIANMSAQSGEVLTFNGIDWGPASPVDPNLYRGTWDPTIPGSIPNVAMAGAGDFYIISKSGTYAGNGVTYTAGDWILEDGGVWIKIPMSSNGVTSYNGQKGVVTTLPSDYVLLKNGSGKIPGSSLNDFANVDLTTTAPVNGNVLKYNGVAWVPGIVSGGGGGGPIGSAEITDLSITGADIAENTINPSKIYSSSIDSALYLRGDKTWANFNDAVLNVPLSTYTINATVKPTIGVTDKIVDAFGKVQKFLNDLNGDYVSKTAASQVVSGTFSFTSPTSFLYTQLPTGSAPTEVTNVQYVQNYVSSAVSGLGYAPVTFTTATAATSSDTTLNVASTAGYPSVGTLLVGNEAIIYSGKTTNSFTGLTRGVYGTTAAAITNGTSVNNYVLVGKSTETVAPKFVVTGNGNVGIGTSSPSEALDVNKNLMVQGQSFSGAKVISTGASVDFNDGNLQVLQNVGGSSVTLSNLKNGGSYILIVTDTNARTYTFAGCTNALFNPANGDTTASTTTIYNILSVTIASVQYCYISWSSGYQ